MSTPDKVLTAVIGLCVALSAIAVSYSVGYAQGTRDTTSAISPTGGTR